VVTPEGRRPLGRIGVRIVTHIKEIGWEYLNWINVSQNREKRQAVVKTVINLWVLNIREISGLAEERLASLSFVADRVLLM
jgi:hypothetical protein